MHCAKCFFWEGDVGDEICNRCGRAFMPEANVYLGLLLLVTGGAAWTLRHLLTGDVDPFVRPTLDLGAWATWPVSVRDHPAYGFVIGGWLAVLAAAPVLAAMMYGKRGGWLLCLAEAVLGPSVVLALVAAVGVWVGGGHTLRLASKLASGMLGLVPSVLYWHVATTLSEVPALSQTLSSMRWVAPPVATVCAAGMVAVVVAVGAADRWHVRWPGAVASALVMGPPLALLAFVGASEVRYAMLPEEGEALLAERIAARVAFLRRHPASDAAARVRAELGLALEEARARGEPLPEETPPPRRVWTDVVEAHPESPWAVVARLHLAHLDAAEGLLDDAARAYADVLERTGGVDVPETDPLADFTLLGNLFRVGRDLRVKEAALRLLEVRHKAMLRAALLAENRTDTERNGRALARYFRALALEGTNRYPTALAQARDAEPKGPLADNVAYRLALFQATEDERLARLVKVAETWPKTDGAVRAHLAAADRLLARHEAAGPDAVRGAIDHLRAARDELERRRRVDPEDPFVLALADPVEKKIAYAEAQLRKPEKGS